MILFLAVAFVPQLQGVAGDEERVFLWPLGSGYEAYQLSATYGQPEGNGRVALHDGLDVTTKRASSADACIVYALEDGVVDRLYIDNSPEGALSGLVIRSRSVPGRAFLYWHLDGASIRFAEGEEVHANEVLGDVFEQHSPPTPSHVHLSRLGGDFVNQRWETIASLSERNPLALLCPEALGDTTPPVVEAIDDECLRFCADQDENCGGSYARMALPASTGGQPRALDVLASVTDSDGGHYPLAPYRMTLTVQDDPANTFCLCLDGPLQKAATVCNRLRRASLGPPRYDYLFVLTNGAPDCNSPCASVNAWRAAAGQHTLELSVEDVAGLKDSVTVTTEVRAP